MMGTVPQRQRQDANYMELRTLARVGTDCSMQGLGISAGSLLTQQADRSCVVRAAAGRRSRALSLVFAAFLCAFGSLTLAPEHALADAKTSYLVRLLQSSSQFRVRAQAALSLGSSCDSPDAEQALISALSDVHPAVRAAAANSLGRIGTEKAVQPLQARANDVEAPVRTAVQVALSAIRKVEPATASSAPSSAQQAAARYYVALGNTGSTVPEADEARLNQARSFLRAKLAELEGVEVAPDNESLQQAKRVLQQRKLTGYYLEGSVNNVQQRPGGGTRVAVSLVLSTYPDRNIRAILRGAATAAGSGTATFQQALEGAFAGAVRQLPQALGQ